MPASAGAHMRQNPYMQGGYIGMGRQNLDQYEAANVKSAKRTSPRSTRGDSQVSRAPGSTAGLDRRLKSPQNSPPRERGSPSSGKSPPKSSSKAASPPKASSPPRAASSAFSAVAAVAALTPGSPASPPSPPPPAPAVSSELHELKELFAAPARPELAQPSEPPPPPPPQPQPEPQPNPLELLPIHPGFSEAWKEHLATSPRPSKSYATSSPPARAPAALVQHVRPVVSKYGGMIAAGTTVAVPPQPWEGSSPRLSEESVIAFKSKPNFSKAGAIVTDDQGANRRDGYAGRSGSTNMTLCESEPSFRARSPPVGTVVQAGVPGYTGHVPHGIGAEPHVVSGRVHHLASTDAFATKEHKALDQTRPHIPKAMPPPGYAGHLHGTLDSTAAFGTSRWQPATPVSHEPKTLKEGDEGKARNSSGWPLSSGVPDPMPVGGASQAAVGSRYEKTIATLGRF